MLQGLTVEIDTFHGSDARIYQLPTILQLRERLDFSDYPSAQTPLFHLVMAGWGKLVGFELWKLRLLNVAISYGAALALLRLLRRTTSLAAAPAFALSLAFALSPYFFGASFTLLTDNLAILFALLALERVHAYATRGSLAALATACALTCGAVMTRQSFLWLALVLAVFVVVREHRSPARLLGGARADRARAGAARGARDRVERARPAERRPGVVRALHGSPGRRPRRADAAHGRLHRRAVRRLRGARARAGAARARPAATARRPALGRSSRSASR